MLPLEHSVIGAFCNTFDLHSALIGLKNQFSVFLRVAVLHRFYCIQNLNFKGAAFLYADRHTLAVYDFRKAVIKLIFHAMVEFDSSVISIFFQ